MADGFDIEPLTLVSLIERIEKEYPEWTWLVRRTKSGEYFANIVSPDFKQFITEKGSTFTGSVNRCTAKTPTHALGGAYRKLGLGLGETKS